MKRNIYQKLHDACLKATGVKKGEKQMGCISTRFYTTMFKQVATQALLDNGLYAIVII